MRRAWTGLCRLSGLRSHMQQQPVCNSWSLVDGAGFVTGMDTRRNAWSDRSSGAGVQNLAGHPVLGHWRSISSAAVGQLSRELRGGLGLPMLFAGGNPFVDGSVRFKSQKKKSKKKKNAKKASKEDRSRLRMLQRERKLRKLSMTPEERLVFRIRKAKVKIALQEQAVKKYALPERPEKPDDPEVLTPEQLHALKKLGYKNKNYVPVGRRGIYGGVIQNMHLHWKKHETVRVDCDNYKKDEVKEMAVELEKISGGKVIDIHQGTTIIMYRGKNYKQPKKLIPDNMLDKRKALLKSLIDQSLKSLREYVAKLEVELETLRARMAEEAASSPPQLLEEPVNERQPSEYQQLAHARLDAAVQWKDDELLMEDSDEEFDTSDLSSESDSEDEDPGHDDQTVPDADCRDAQESGEAVWETDYSDSNLEGEDHDISFASTTSITEQDEELCKPGHATEGIMEVQGENDLDNSEEGTDNQDGKSINVPAKEYLQPEGSGRCSAEQKLAEQVSVG